MFGKQKPEKTSYGIVGLGRFGTALACELAKTDAEILALDRDEEKVREMREVTEHAIVVHSLDKKTLMETGIQNCDVAIVCIGEHMESHHPESGQPGNTAGCGKSHQSGAWRDSLPVGRGSCLS